MSGGPTFQARLAARNLALARGGRRIVEGVDLDLGPGDAVVLRGANGAGKTTLLRALAGLLRPTEGAVEVAGAAADGARVYCGTQNAVKAALSVRANLRFWGALYGADAPRVAAARNAMGLSPYSDDPAGALSTGFARRLALSRLLIADRPIWCVDEPTAGLDAGAARAFADIVEAHRARGGLAIVATHEPLELEGARTLQLAASALASAETGA